jgi:hypothetical protein
MIPPLDPFAQSFDSIEIDRAPSPAAIESAFASIAPTAAAPDDGQPGYFLMNDAGGRFTVDREMGVVMLRDETLLTREHGAVYPARLRVVELSGASYDLDLQLRITGRVPQVVGAEDLGLGGGEALLALASVQAPAPQVAWTDFAPALGAQTKPSLTATGAYGALLGMTLPASNARATIALSDTIPTPAPAHAAWSL